MPTLNPPALSRSAWILLGLGVLAAALFLPGLGGAGFWDPWEPHYTEVAREMIARGDYVHPWWESSYFFSKPALDLWLMAAGLLAAGAGGPAAHAGSAMAPSTELFVRLPFAMLSGAGVLVLFAGVQRLLGLRPALLGTVAILTAPLTVLLAHQAVPDPVFLGLLSASMGCLACALLCDDLGAEARDAWMVAFAIFVGLATLSKGLLGFALPGAVALVYVLVTGEWHRLGRLRLGLTAVLVLLVAGPWYGTMFAFPKVDDEGNTFFERFIIHDHFKRLVTGVHTTTPGGTFAYFIEQLGFDAFPWVMAVPGALACAARLPARPREARERCELFLLLWLLVGFSVFALSATKFHHYAFPVLPPLLLLCGAWLDRVLEQGLRAHAGALLAGGALFGLVAHDLAQTPKHLADLFVYNYDRPYPAAQVDPRRLFAALFIGAAALALSPWILDRLAQLGRGARDLLHGEARRRLRAAVGAAWRGPRAERDEPPVDRAMVVASVCLLGLCLALAMGWHWRELSPHWTQRDLLRRYAAEAKSDEPLGAYLMNWRGETFYSRNTVRQLRDSGQLQRFLSGPGPRKWLLMEQGRVPYVRQAVGAAGSLRIVEGGHTKYALAVIDPPEGPPALPPPGLQPPVR